MVKQNLNENIEEYYKWILTLANSFKHPTYDQLLNAFFKASLLLYLWVAIIDIKQGMLIQHLELTMIYEESSTNVDGNRDSKHVPNDETRK